MSALAWGRPIADVVLAALLVLVLRRLGHDPSAAWRERESALRAIFDDLRALVAQAEGLARDLDGKLAARATELRRLAAESAAAAAHALSSPPASRADAGLAADRPLRGRRGMARADDRPDTAPDVDLAARIRELTRAAMTVEDIARQLDVSAAEVRLVIGIEVAAGRMAPGGSTRSAPPRNGATAAERQE